jgi:membrane protein YqaA with SNARE-associated domain
MSLNSASQSLDPLREPAAPGAAEAINLRYWFFGFLAWLILLTTVGLVAFQRMEQGTAGCLGLWLLAVNLFYLSLCCLFVPLPTVWVILLLASHEVALVESVPLRVLVVSVACAAATTVANLNEYHLVTFALRYRRFGRVRETRLYRRAVAWLAVSPFWTITLFSFVPIPVDVVRLLAIGARYSRVRFAGAYFLGRVVRYGLLALSSVGLRLTVVEIFWIQAVLVALAGLKVAVSAVRRAKSSRRRSFMLSSVAVVVAGLVWGAAPPAQPATAQPTSGPATQPADAPTIEGILDRMEARGDTVNDLTCEVRFTVEDLVGLAEFTKFGKIRYKRTQPNPSFLIEFYKMHEGGIVVKNRKEWYLFTDRWLYEAKSAGQTVIKREVIREGEVVDLFSLESAPFPIPFGQRKEEIRRNFLISLVSPQPSDPPDTDHLICVPKPGSRLADEYSRLEFYVSRRLNLPVKIVATEADPDGEPAKITTAVFPDLSAQNINTGLKLSAFKLPPETDGYQVIEEPLAQPVAEPPSRR